MRDHVGLLSCQITLNVVYDLRIHVKKLNQKLFGF